MSESKPFLLEIGVEEIPHWMLEPALQSLSALLSGLWEQNGLEHAALQADATPRRLVVRTASIQTRQEDRTELVMGPPKAAGEGAAAGFARKQGADPASLIVESTPKGEYFAVRKSIEGRETCAILAEALPGIIGRIPWPKTMYWTGKDGMRFIRPIRWIVALLGDQIVEFQAGGVRAGALSRGHRRLGADEIAFDHENYEARLEKNGVILSFEKRRKRILDGIRKLLRGTGLSLVDDDALLKDLCYLTEFPTPILGEFNSKYLELPSEVLTTVMRHHQRYFSLRDANGGMAPNFIAVMNLKADRKGFVKKGNERVLVARFNDARFFWEVDLQRSLTERLPDLEHVTFQAQLGSYLEKTKRVQQQAANIAAVLGLDPVIARRAAELSKTDLTTSMVKEFTDLQGVMGGLYARAQGEPGEVWRAIYEHYRPLSMDDAIPSTPYGQVLSLADKFDTLASCFAVGLAPTSSKDPFALRRAAQGIVKVCVEGGLRIPIRAMEAEVLDFFLDRVRYYFRDIRGYAYDEVNAVLAADPPDLVEADLRLAAVKRVRKTENFEPLAASFKRIRNILKQANWTHGEVNPPLFEAEEERALHASAAAIAEEVRRDRAENDYLRALNHIASLRPAVDRFFDKVLVNAPDERVRNNRLALLGRLMNEFSSIADFSEIVTTS